jgi:hypothetical protein
MRAQVHSEPAIEMFRASLPSSTFATAVVETMHALLAELNRQLVAQRTAHADRVLRKGLRGSE